MKLTQEQKDLIRDLGKTYGIADIKAILQMDYNISPTYRTIHYWSNPEKSRTDASKWMKKRYLRIKNDPKAYRRLLDYNSKLKNRIQKERQEKIRD